MHADDDLLPLLQEEEGVISAHFWPRSGCFPSRFEPIWSLCLTLWATFRRKWTGIQEEDYKLTPHQEMMKAMNVAKAATKLKRPLKKKPPIDHLAAARAAADEAERLAWERAEAAEAKARRLAEAESLQLVASSSNGTI